MSEPPTQYDMVGFQDEPDEEELDSEYGGGGIHRDAPMNIGRREPTGFRTGQGFSDDPRKWRGMEISDSAADDDDGFDFKFNKKNRNFYMLVLILVIVIAAVVTGNGASASASQAAPVAEPGQKANPATVPAVPAVPAVPVYPAPVPAPVPVYPAPVYQAPVPRPTAPAPIPPPPKTEEVITDPIFDLERTKANEDDKEEGMSCKDILKTKHPPNIPTDSVGSCETSLRKPYDTKMSKKQIANMEAYVQSISNGGTFDSISRMVLFFASGRSGHTWLGALLDAAPNAMVANQRNSLLDYFDGGMKREQLFTELAQNSWFCGNGPDGWLQTYNYTVPGLWQGRIDENEKLEVIGDKNGGQAIHWLKEWILEAAGDDFDLVFGDYDAVPGLVDYVNSKLDEYFAETKVERRYVVNIRHPGNIAATVHARNKPEKKGHKYSGDSGMYGILGRIRSGLWAMEHVGKPEQWHLVVTEHFATDTHAQLSALCTFVGVKCPPQYMETIVGQTHHEIHQTWTDINWKENQLTDYNKFITQYLSEWYEPMCV